MFRTLSVQNVSEKKYTEMYRYVTNERKSLADILAMTAFRWASSWVVVLCMHWWKRATVNEMYFTCAFSAMTSQNVSSERGFFSLQVSSADWLPPVSSWSNTSLVVLNLRDPITKRNPLHKRKSQARISVILPEMLMCVWAGSAALLCVCCKI